MDEIQQTGNYVLILHLPFNEELTLGTLGKMPLPAGFYAYVGRASVGYPLAEHLQQYLAPQARAYRHIDYLLRTAPLQEIWLSPGAGDQDAAWIDLLLTMPGAMLLVDGFGPPPAGLETRLIYFELRPDLADFQLAIRQALPGQVVLRMFNRGEAMN